MTAMAPRPDLPRTLRLPPYRSLLHHGPGGRLLGLDPRTALAVDGLSPPLAWMLDELVAPVEGGPLVARAVGRGADARAAGDLLQRLLDAGALVDASGAERVARHRAGAAVAVVGGGPVAVGVAVGLALAGVGQLFLDVAVAAEARGSPADEDDAVVGDADLGTGLLDADRGRPLAAAVPDVVRRVAPGARVGPPPARAVPDVCVFADVAAPEPVRVAALHRDRVAHLPVRLRDDTGLVGPLVLPGRSACLGCVELHRRSRDPDWPAVAAQLVGRPGLGTAATASATAALGVAQVVAALDAAGGCGDGTAPAPPALGATLELDLAGGALRRRAWTPHPGCPCGAPAAETCGPAAEQGTIMG